MSAGEPKKPELLPEDRAALPESREGVPPWLQGLDASSDQIPIDATLSGVLPAQPPPASKDVPAAEVVDLTLAGEYPSWGELPRLEVSDQASMIMAFRLPSQLPELT